VGRRIVAVRATEAGPVDRLLWVYPSGQEGANPGSVQSTTIRINDKQIAAQAYLYLALDRGYFHEQGLEVHLVRVDGGTDVTAALAAGDIEFADTAPTAPMFNAISRGVRVKALLSTGLSRPGDHSNGIVVRQDLIDSGRYRGPADLKGMRIAVQTPGGSTWYVAQQALARAGWAAADAEFVILAFPDALAGLAGKAVDAAYEVEPFITTARERGIGQLVTPSADVVPNLQGPMLMVSTTYADNHTDVVTRFVTASLRGLRDYTRAVEGDPVEHRATRARHAATICPRR